MTTNWVMPALRMIPFAALTSARRRLDHVIALATVMLPDRFA